MELRKASRKKAKIRLGLQGPSGSGKTYTALLIAFGLCGNWSKIAVIDTESNSADLYSHLGPFNVLNISAPFIPEKFIDAIKTCENAEMEVIILDSSSHEWEGILAIHGNMQGNSFVNWAKLTPRHSAFVQGILQSNAHVIVTTRTKQDYVLTEKSGKLVPEKVGLKAVQREGLDYDLTLVFDLDIKNMAKASKDRTGLFMGLPEEKLTVDTGRKILHWCNEGVEPNQLLEELLSKIQSALTVDELINLFKSYPEFQEKLLTQFTERRKALTESNQLSKSKSSNNGRINPI